MEIPTHQNHVYTLTCENACEVYDVDTDRLLHEHHAGEAQSQFTAIGMKVRVTDDTAHITEVFSGAAIGNGAGGGHINSDLNVGHGAADAVAAVCTLTLGDLATGGTLTDGTTTLTLENPHTYATGRVGIADAAEAGTIKFGEHGAIEFNAAPGTKATGYFICMPDNYEVGGTLKLVRGEEVLFEHVFQPPQGAGWTLEGIAAALEADPAWECEIFETVSEIDFHAPAVGAGWNDVELVLEGELFDNGGVYHGGMFDGTDARTPQEVAAALNASADCPAVALLDADELGISFTAKDYGANDEIAVTGGLFEDAEGMSGGHGDYSVQEIVSAINAETDFDVTAAAAETEGVITLTANTAGAAANAVVYTATGCFGSGSVKQGGTVRGRNAVEQTDFKVYVNGEELFGESTVVVDAVEANNANAVTSNAVWNAIQESAVEVDAVPTQGSENAVSSGGVYTALAGKQGTLTAGAGITLSGGTISVNANGAVNATDTKPVSGQTVNAALAEAVGGAALRGENNTFTASNTFKGSFTVGVAHKEPVWAKTTVAITAANVKLAGTVSDNDGHTLELEADADRTQDNWSALVTASELGLAVTRSGNTFTLTDAQSDETEAGTVGNTRVITVTGFGFAATQTKRLSGGVDGILEVPEHIELHGDVSIGHGPEGVKARCTFTPTAANLKLAGTLSDGIHPDIELPADDNRTVASLIAEINEYGDGMEIVASANGTTAIYLEAMYAGTEPNSVTFTRTGCFGSGTTKQGSNRAGISSGRATDYKLLENGYQVANQKSNNTYDGVQTFNNAVVFNGPATRPAAAETWDADTVMTLGMHQVGAWWDELEADLLFNPEVTEFFNGNAVMHIDGTTNAVQTIGLEKQSVAGKGHTAQSELRSSNLVAARVTLNPRAQVKIVAAGTYESKLSHTAFDSEAHKWLWVTWYKGNAGVRDINLIGAYAAANSCPVVLVCDTRLGKDSAGGLWIERPVETRIVDAYLCSAPARGNAAGRADTVCLVLVGAKNGITDLYIGFKRERRLMRHYTVPEFGFGEIGAISKTNYSPAITASRGNLATSGEVDVKADMWTYQGTYQPADPAGSAAFFVKDAQYGLKEVVFGSINVDWDKANSQAVNVYLAGVQTEQPSTDPAADYTYSETAHENKDDVEVPASGGYVLAKIVWGPLNLGYSGNASPQAIAMDSWLVDTSAGADEDGWVISRKHQNTWKLSKNEGTSFDTSSGTETCYAYIKVPANTTGEERDGYAVVGISGMRASLIHIVQAAE